MTADGQDRTKTAALTDRGESLSRWLCALWDGGTARYRLPEAGSLVIGRSEACEMQIDHSSVSRRHAVWHAGRPDRIEDRGSANGTRVNGRRLSRGETADVFAGDVVEVGRAMLIVQALPPPPDVEARVTGDGGMKRALHLAELAAPTSMTILLLGETGVGKDLFAERIHQLSPRANAPFVRVNCAALPGPLLESELFGHERGAFTGATNAKPGLLEAANGGSLFLDEIGELPLETQAKLLLVLERREVRRVGSNTPRPIDVRFIAATNRDLSTLMAHSEFRPDLFFRLNGVTLEIPPLRSRLDELPGLVQTFVRQAAEELGKPPPTVSAEAITTLERRSWPGNIRELRTVVQRLVLFATGSVVDAATLAAALGPDASAGAPPASLRAEKEALERRRIFDALDQCGGNQSKAAVLLGMPRRTLVARLSAYGVVRKR